MLRAKITFDRQDKTAPSLKTSQGKKLSVVHFLIFY
jgi:hypothetical protein